MRLAEVIYWNKNKAKLIIHTLFRTLSFWGEITHIHYLCTEKIAEEIRI